MKNIETSFLLFSGISFLVGNVILFISKIITAQLELVNGIGINLIDRYHFNYYGIAAFIIGVVFLVLSFLSFFKSLINNN